MSQPNDPQSKSNTDVNDKVVVALQQYNDTKGHFSLVRWVTAFVAPLWGLSFLILTEEGGPEIFD